MKKIILLLAFIPMLGSSQALSVSPEYTIFAMTESSYTIGTHSPERTNDTTKVWKEDFTSGKPILNTYLFCGVNKWDSNKIACYKKSDNAALVIVDTMATIRLFYLEIIEKQKEINEKNAEIQAFQDLTTSVWYNPSLPENKKYLAKLKKYNKQFGWNFSPHKSKNTK